MPITLLRAQTYLQLQYGNGVFGNVYLSAGQHYEVNIAGTSLRNTLAGTPSEKIRVEIFRIIKLS